MQSSMLKAIVEDFGNGGTIDGDLTISGDLTVSGGGSLSFDEILEGTQVIDVTSTEALLVRKNGDGGDVFLVDTTNSNAELTGDMKITNTAATIGLEIAQSGDNHALKIDQDDADKSAIFIDAESTTAHVIYIDGAATTTAAVIRMDGLGGLTTGAMFNANITSTTLETGADTGAFRIVHSGNSGSKVANIMHLHNDDASSTGTTVLKLQQDSTAPALVAMGNVGIGTAAPSTPLHIYENTSTTSTAGVLIEQDGSGDCLLSFLTSGIQRWVTGIDSSDSAYKIAKTTNLGTDTVLTLDTSSNVGIQNPAPGSLLEISKVSGRASLELSSWSATATAAHAGVLKFQKSGTATVNTFTAGDHTTAGEVLGRIEAYGVDDADGSTLSSYIEFANDAVSDADSSPGKITFATSDADDAGTPTVAMTIDDSQNIGVGTDTPLGTIHAVSSDVSWSAPAYGDEIIAENNGDAGISIVSSNESYLVLSNANRSGSYSALIYSAYNSGNDYLAINTVGGGEVMRLDHSGNVGVGTGATIDENIHIKGAGVVSAKIQSTDSADLSLIYSHASRTVTTGLDQSADAFSICNGTVLTAVGASTTLLNLDIGGASRISLSNNDSGTSNTIFGKSAGASLDAGSNYNVFIGEAVSDASMNDATNNVGVGYSALSALTTGDYNTCVGSGAGGGTTDGVRNVFIGQAAGETSTSITYAVGIGGNAIGGAQATADAIGTVAVGYNALTALTSGAGNTAIGYNSMSAQTDGEHNTVIGFSAFDAADSGESNNVVIGSGAAGAMNTATCDNNVIIGKDAGVGGVATLAGCVAIGAASLTATGNIGASDSVFIGKDSGGGSWSTAGCDNNTAVGAGTMAGAMNGAANNVAVGKSALTALTTGSTNIAVGARALTTITTGSENTVVGFQSAQAFSNAETGNISIGANAMNSFNEGGDGGDINYNIALGLEAFLGGSLAGGTNEVIGNIAIGAYALDGTTTNAHTGTIAIGYQALTALTTGGHNTAIGYNSMLKLTTGAENVAIGKLAMEEADGGESYNVAVGFHAMGDVDHDDSDANVAIGGSALAGGDAAVKNCVAIGYNALDHTAGNAQDGTVAIGKGALTALTSGASNVAIGYETAKTLTTGGSNTIVGYNSLIAANTAANSNATLGTGALQNASGSTCVGNVAIGMGALTAGSGNLTGNIAIGKNALDDTLGNNHEGTIAIGHQALSACTTGAGNTAIGYQTGLLTTTGGANVYIGWKAADATHVDCTGNIAIGQNAFGGTHTGTVCHYNTAVGASALAGAMNGVDGATALGFNALEALTTGAGNTAVGYNSMTAHTTGARNTAIGYLSMSDTDSNGDSQNGVDNTFVGYQSGGGEWGNGATDQNTGIGAYSLGGKASGTTLTAALSNSALGYNALTALTTGDSNTAIGWSAGAGVTTGHSNVILGRGACNDSVVLADGTANIVIGMNSRTSATDSANQIVIGHDISGTGDNDFAFGKASNVVHNDFDTDAAWSRTSDVRLKTSINNAVLGLDFVNDLRPVTYKWKSTQDLDESDSQLSKLLPNDVLDKDGKVVQAKDTIEHMNTDTTMHGLIAQEVKEALDKAGIDTFKGWSQDDDGVQNISREMFIIPLIKAVQELTAKVEALEAK